MTEGNLKKEPIKDKVMPAIPAINKETNTEKIPEGIKDGSGKDEYNVEVIVDYDGKIDPFYLSQKDPEYSYRYLRDDPKNLSTKTSNMLLQKGGWQLVPREHLLKLGIDQKYIAGDGFYRVGDTILARMPIELFKKKEEYKQKLADAPMNAVERMTKKGDTSEGGKDIHDSMKGIQTKDQMGNVTWR